MTDILLAFASSFAGGIIFNIKKENLLWSGVSGALGWLAYSLLHRFTGDNTLSTFVGAAVVSIFSEGMARLLKSPATIYSIPGIFPLVPGIAAYTTFQYIMENKLSSAASKGIETLFSAAAIAFGIMLVYGVFRFASRLNEGNPGKS